MATDVDVDRYLARIGYDGDRTPTAANLAALQWAHLVSVPFENLDVFARTGVRVGRDWSVPKIVERRRGGWCFECNGAFSALLGALGYEVTLHSAQVDQQGVLGPPLDHLVLVAHVDGRRLLVDVGFGDAPTAPLDVDEREPQDGGVRPARLVAPGEGPEGVPGGSGGVVELWDRRGADGWMRLSRVDLAPRGLDEFEARSTELQTAPGLMWTERRFATRATADGGRVWLLTDRLRVRGPDGSDRETPVAPEDWDSVAAERFGLRLDR